ncbi:N-acyl-D-glutamate deacylase [Lecanosticta acicola]|uniref:N-acyl-D-glutamate deacylase n=1 Tax=Lecanosticta acicola TaxID=111012 RepID=A0AAI8Z7D4_9PEZI|nr:N-acyl-D-glutamate deacylase [Lecanosticta acicola]
MSSSEEEILLLGPSIVDGSGTKPAYIANVLIKNGHIAQISNQDIPTSPNTRIIDCQKGKFSLCPGFIDMHAHSDLSLLHTPDHLAKITQGVTTEVIGQDGIGYAPVDDDDDDGGGGLARIRKQIRGWNGDLPDAEAFTWRSVKQYLDVMDSNGGRATNVAFLVPQGNLRILVKGWDSSPATSEELAQMQEILRRGFEEGAVGMSSGLTYVPGMFASDQEIATLCETVREFGGYYCPHTRSYGKGALQAYGEMIALAEKVGVRLHLTHATMNYEENAGRAQELLDLIDRAAAADGVEISLDTYPYLPGSTTLASTLPSWVGGAPDPASLLRDPATLEQIRRAAMVEGTDGCHGCTLHWSLLEIGGVQNAALQERYVGKTIQQIADEERKDAFDKYVEILLEDHFNSTILSHSGHEGNVRKIMRHARHTGGSDGILTSTKPHPRGWGTFPRYLGHYARDLPRGRERDLYHASSSEVYNAVEPEAIFSGGLEEAVAHLTSRPAAVIRVQDRGLVKEGYKADLVLFDKEEIRDVATFANPQQAAKGIRMVMVNGTIVVDEGEALGVRAGQTIRGREEDGERVVR